MRCWLLSLVLIGVSLGACSQQHARRGATPDAEEADPEGQLDDEANDETDASSSNCTLPPVPAAASAGQEVPSWLEDPQCGGERRTIAPRTNPRCIFTLSFHESDPNYLRVFLDGALLDRDPGDDWSLVGDVTVLLRGAACSLLNDGQGHELSVRHECRVLPICRIARRRTRAEG